MRVGMYLRTETMPHGNNIAIQHPRGNTYSSVTGIHHDVIERLSDYTRPLVTSLENIVTWVTSKQMHEEQAMTDSHPKGHETD